MMTRTGASVPAERGLIADGLVRLTVAEMARIAAHVVATHLGADESTSDA